MNLRGQWVFVDFASSFSSTDSVVVAKLAICTPCTPWGSRQLPSTQTLETFECEAHSPAMTSRLAHRETQLDSRCPLAVSTNYSLLLFLLQSSRRRYLLCSSTSSRWHRDLTTLRSPSRSLRRHRCCSCCCCTMNDRNCKSH